MKTNTQTTESAVAAIKPKYYEENGAILAYANRAWLLAFLTIPLALIAIGFAIYVRIQPPTVIGLKPDFDSVLLGKPAKGVPDNAIAGTDPRANEAFVRKFLKLYLNYSPANADEHWSDSLNMMTKNLRDTTRNAMKDQNSWGKVQDNQIQSVFTLREIDTVPSAPLTYLVYGVKDVHRIDKGYETTDHLVNEYRIRLKTDNRSDINPDGLWIADYSERPIDGERRDHILAAPDASTENGGAENGGGQ